ncbi:MAG TPA: hypothetical protein VGN90_12715 [Pyrinomonadaceae bacterium]|jgi:hypothetical protein|nr:hypothetical protein [Pyrinomonadaceae bacterium]
MAKNETKRLKPAQIQLDTESYQALQANTRYAPANPQYALSGLPLPAPRFQRRSRRKLRRLRLRPPRATMRSLKSGNFII